MTSMAGIWKALTIPVSGMKPEERGKLWRTVAGASCFTLCALAFGAGIAYLIVG